MVSKVQYYRDKNGVPVASNMDEPSTSTPIAKPPLLGGGGTPQSRYAEQQRELTGLVNPVSQQQQSQPQHRQLNYPQLQPSFANNDMINNAIANAIGAGQKDMGIGVNRVAAKYAGQQLGDLLGAVGNAESLQQRNNEALINAQQRSDEMAQRNSGAGLSRHFESTADGIMSIDPLTGQAKPVMDSSGRPLKRANNDMDLQAELLRLRNAGKTQQAVEQGTALLPIKQQEGELKTQQAVNEKRALEDSANQVIARNLGESTQSIQKLLYGDEQVARDNEGNPLPPKSARVLGNTPEDRIRMASYETLGNDDTQASNTVQVRNAAKQVGLDALGGKLGVGTSNADVEFIMSQIGIISNAQNINDIYRAYGAMENRQKQIADRSARGEKGDFVPGASNNNGQNAQQPASAKAVNYPRQNMSEKDIADWEEYKKLYGE